MSFGLLTATEIEHVPLIMKRIAASWRNVKTRRYQTAWLAVADLLDQYAAEAAKQIADIKKSEPRVRNRVRLYD